MHGLILKTLQIFVQDTYGLSTWGKVAGLAKLGNDGFESMLHYDVSALDGLLTAMETVLDRPREAVLEDVGTFLVSHPNMERLRRLLRFSGDDYIDFLFSIDDLPDRARLVISDLELPELETLDLEPTVFKLNVTGSLPGFGHVMVGLLRAMADDYGALVLLDYAGLADNTEEISIMVVESQFAEGRGFNLAADLPERDTA